MGLTQVDVAGALGLAQGLISKNETGDLLLHGELIVKFARVLGVSSYDLLAIESKRSKPALPAIDKTLARRLAQLQTLPRRDRDALLRTLDAFLAKSSHAASLLSRSVSRSSPSEFTAKRWRESESTRRDSLASAETAQRIANPAVDRGSFKPRNPGAVS